MNNRLYEIAKQYHEECEIFDLAICGFIDEVSGMAMPSNSIEFQKINKNAKIILNRLISENKDIPSIDIKKAISSYA